MPNGKRPLPGAAGLLVFSGESFYEREDVLEEFIPIRNLVDPALLEIFSRGVRVRSPAKLLNPVLAVLEVWFDAVAKVSAGQPAEAGFGGKMFLPDARDVDEFHRTDAPEPAKSLVRRAATHAEPAGEIIQGDRFFCAEEEPVNFPDRPWNG